MSDKTLEYALKYAELGWAVSTRIHGTKLPHKNTHGFKDASKDPADIRKMYEDHPGSNLAVTTGSTSGIIVLDIDVKGNENGWNSLTNAGYPVDEMVLSGTPRQTTPSKGAQFFFKAPKRYIPSFKGSNPLLEGFEILSEGTSAMLPPSFVRKQKGYDHEGFYIWDEGLSPWESDLKELPDFFLAKIIEKAEQQKVSKEKQGPFKLPKVITKNTRNDMMFKLACSLRAKNIPYDQVLTICSKINKDSCKPPLENNEIKAFVESAFKYPEKEDDQSWDRTQRGKLRPTYNNALNFLETEPIISDCYKFNVFSQEVEVFKKPAFDSDSFGEYPKEIDDEDLLKLKKFFRQKRFEPSKAIIEEAVTTFSLMHSYNPVLDYLTGLKWDGVDRLTNWFHTYLGAHKGEYNDFVGKMFLSACCARIDKPGCKYDYIVIIEGEQGLGKSQAVQILGSPWFKEISLTERDKDTVQKMQGAWLVEVPEMTCFKKKDLESLKAFITTQVDNARFSYRRTDKKYPRRCVFVGTLNPDSIGYLTDRTGNRRFLPIRAHNIRLGKLRADKHQIWAQAWKLYSEGFPLYINNESIMQEAKKQQSLREITDDWGAEIDRWIKQNPQVHSATSLDLFTEAIGGAKEFFSPIHSRRIATAMAQMGYTDVEIRKVQGTKEKVFKINEETPWED